MQEVLVSRLMPNWIVPIRNFPMNFRSKIDPDKLKHYFFQCIKGKKWHASMISSHRLSPLIRKPLKPRFIEQSSEVSKHLYQLWCQYVPDYPQYAESIYDDFFSLGGDSVAAIQICFDIQSFHQIKITLNELLCDSSFHAMVQVIEHALKIKDKVNQLKNPEIQDGHFYTEFKIDDHYYFSAPLQQEFHQYHVENHQQDPNIECFVYQIGRREFHSEAFKQACWLLVKRHVALRSAFSWKDNKSVFKFIEAYDPFVQEAWMDEISEELFIGNIKDRHEDQYRRYNIFSKPTRLSFDLSSGRLLKVGILNTKHSEESLYNRPRYLVIAFHRIAMDDWSYSLFMQELAKLYEEQKSQYRSVSLPSAFFRNQHGVLDSNKVYDVEDDREQFLDYLQNELNWYSIEKSDLQTSIQFLEGDKANTWKTWSEKMLQFPNKHSMPTKFSTPLKDSGTELKRFKHILITMSKDYVGPLLALSRRLRITPFMIFESCFSILLAKWQKVSEVVIQTQVINRIDLLSDKLIGPLANQQFIHHQLNPYHSFEEYLEQVKTLILTSLSQPSVPTGVFLKKLRKETSGVCGAFKHPQFVYRTSDDFKLALAGVDITLLEGYHTLKSSDLCLEVRPQSSKHHQLNSKHFLMHWSYDTETIREDVIELMSRQYEVLLQSVIYHPEKSLNDLNIFQTLPVKGKMSGVQSSWLEHETLQDLIEVIAEKYPKGIAIVMGAQTLTYEQLSLQSNQIAHFLLQRSIIHSLSQKEEKTPSMIIGVMLPRTPLLITVLLGILKAGYGFLLLDINDSIERRRQIILHSGIELILSIKVQQDFFKNEFMYSNELPVQWLCLDDNRQWSRIQRSSWSKPDIRGKKTDIVCIHYENIKPRALNNAGLKGIIYQQESLIRQLNWMQSTFTLNQALDSISRVFHKSSYIFSAALWEIFWPLISGAIVVLDHKQTLVPSTNVDLEIFSNQSIDFLHVNPEELLSLLNDVKLNVEQQGMVFLKEWRLKSILCYVDLNQGKMCSSKLIQLCQRILPNVSIHLIHGFSEIGFHGAYIDCSPWFDGGLSVGKPIEETKMWVLNEKLQPVSMGTIGDLYFESPNLTLGYWKDQVLTDKHFINTEILNQNKRCFKTQYSVYCNEESVLLFAYHQEDLEHIENDVAVNFNDWTKILLEHDSVVDVFIFITPHSTSILEKNGDEGVPQSKTAYIIVIIDSVDNASLTALKQQLERMIGNTIPPEQIRLIWRFCDEWPLDATGQVNLDQMIET